MPPTKNDAVKTNTTQSNSEKHPIHQEQNFYNYLINNESRYSYILLKVFCFSLASFK